GWIAGDPFPEKLRLADRRHAALLRHLNELAIVVVCHALRREGTTGDAPQEERPDGLRMTPGEQQRQPAARGTAADAGRHGIELREQGLEVIGPDLLLGFVTRNHNVRGTAVAAIMEQHTVTSRRHLLGERQDAAKVAATTGGKRHPRTMLTKDLVVDVHASYV